ncbi:MAG: T9SS type B sorting domain-containing protein [Flavobacteriaceae bacterium]|nr:T9SS type B sorting domain-containing protein [Flavobacteriaceae bacterium]
MRNVLSYIILLIPFLSISQNIQVDSQTYTPQQLIEDILIDSDCIENVVVTNVVGGDFSGTDQSYGFFDASGTTFPFQSGIVLSTGRLENTEGPNTTLSDDDAPNWLGDSDLENVLNESNTLNATILEFDFTANVTSQISFRYIFASEEYQENNPNTCNFSDLFGFLIRPTASTQYDNIALVPNTNIPVKVTTVHPDIPGGCQAENETYFESFNDSVSPINFNGQTTVLTASADVVANETYHVKLVIADEQNYRYDSAVFLEAGSFQLSTDLGEDRLLSTNNPLCENDTLMLDATQAGINTYRWFRNGIQVGTNPTYEVVDAAVYTVEVTLGNNCISYGEIIIEYSPNPIVFDAEIVACDFDQDGVAFYNLFDAQESITNGDATLTITNFFLIENDAILNSNLEIPNPTNYENISLNQVVYARVEAITGCFSIAEVQLSISNNTVNILPFAVCDEGTIDGFSNFDLNQITATFQSQIPVDAIVTYYETEEELFDGIGLISPYENKDVNSQLLYVKIISNNQCFAVSTVQVNVLDTPLLLDDETKYYCTNIFPNTIRLFGGIQNGLPENYTYQWLFNTTITSVNTAYNDINESGVYTVIVTHPNGCSTRRIITVLDSSIATIQNITIEEGTYNNTVTIEVTGEGVYEYILDDIDGDYQESNIITNVLPGFHTVYVRDRNGCEIAQQLISVLGFPKYFTPNNDGIHDTWQALGVNAQYNQGIDVKIFDRYGKIIIQFNHLSDGWDGTYNGEKLPSSDYWYLVILIDGRVFRGHFTLKR